MTVKPPLNESVIAICAAAGVGLVAGLPTSRRRAVRAA
jgi:hypothetical protein